MSTACPLHVPGSNLPVVEGSLMPEGSRFFFHSEFTL